MGNITDHELLTQKRDTDVWKEMKQSVKMHLTLILSSSDHQQVVRTERGTKTWLRTSTQSPVKEKRSY